MSTVEHRRGTPAGTFTRMPLGVLLHGSRGGAADVMTEYRGTANWAVTNPDGLCWHSTIGPGIYAVHLTAQEWGWNARSSSDDYVAVEFAQATINDGISDAQVTAFVDWYRAEVAPVWPALEALLASDAALPSHQSLPVGQADGKTDVFVEGDARLTDLRRRIRAGLAGAAGGPPYASANDAYDAWVAAHADTVVWSGEVAGRGHWCGKDPQPIARTAGARLLAYDGAIAVDVTGLALDDWQVIASGAGQLIIW